MICLQDNFNSFNYTPFKYIYINMESKKDIANKKIITEKLEITLDNYQSKSRENTFFSFFKNEEKRNLKNEDDLIISIKKSKNDNEDIYHAQTGNYVGRFVWNGLEIDIKPRFSNTFLERMLNFANDIFLYDVSITGHKSEELDMSKYIIYYMFVQNLEKAFLLGLPKAYRSINHHEMKLKGKIDINRFIKYDIPFQGKISSTSREQKEIQEIIDILYKAVKIIEKQNKEFLKNISHIKTHLKQHRSNKYVSNETINKALKSKALQNPVFRPYKKVLEYAKFIINASNLEENSKGKEKTFGFIVNISELFEIYLVKLLQHRMPDWEVAHEEKLELYRNNFYGRKMLPDIVLKNKNKVIVFDAKYKRMTFQKGIGDGKYGDLDRSDFFQINTYMTYYNNQPNTKLVAGGLLYPIEKEFDKSEAHSDNWLGNTDVKFIVDGIDLTSKNQELTMDDIKISENAFIERIEIISGEYK